MRDGLEGFQRVVPTDLFYPCLEELMTVEIVDD